MRLKITLLGFAIIFCLLEAIGEDNLEAPKLIADALRLEEAGDLNGAIALYKKVVAIAPIDVRAMNTIAGLFGNLGKFDEEIRWSDRAKRTNPNFVPAYINYGNGKLALGAVEEAKKSFEQAAKLAPKDPLPAYSLGVVQEQQQHFEKALGYYRQSVELDPKFENGYFNMAAMLANLHRNAEARAALTKLLELNPKAEDAQRMLAHIDREALTDKK